MSQKSNIKPEEPSIVGLSRDANTQYQQQRVTDGRQLLIQIYNSIKANPSQLRDVSDFASLGVSFVYMLDLKLSNDIDVRQTMASVGYLCISKAIENDFNNLDIVKFRLLLLQIGHDPLKHTIATALNLNTGITRHSMVGNITINVEARDAIYKMEISDFELYPQLYRQAQFFEERKRELDGMIARKLFTPDVSLDSIIKSGIEIHKQVLDFLEREVIFKNKINF